MKPLLPILCWLWPSLAIAQVKEVSSFQKNDTVRTTVNQPLQKSNSAKTIMDKPEIFTSGFIDIINNGQVNASARFIRLYIGEPGKFSIPLSFYSGVSANNFQNQSNTNGLLRNNDHLVTQYINPLSGLVNVSSDGNIFFRKTEKATKLGWLYHFGERVMTGFKTGELANPQTGKPINFLNSFASSGLYFQTGAWERTNSKNLGLCWLAVRYHICYTNPQQIKFFLSDISTNGIYAGYSMAFGVEINNLVNIKVVYYKYTKEPEIEYTLPIYQFSFNYSLKR